MVITQELTDKYAIYNGDCCEVLKSIPDESIDMSIYSPPFCGLYQYSSSLKDLSNCRSREDFLNHYEFVVSEISRITKPGRLTLVHCSDIPKAGANICTYIDLPGDIIKLHEKHSFGMLPRYSIWKEPLGVRNRTMAKSLAHRQICEDSTLTNCASSDYLIPFRKNGKNLIPVKNPTGLHKYCGERIMPAELQEYKGFTGDQKLNKYSHWIWRNYASSFWDDIRIDNVLPYEESKDPDDERHVHPLQLDVIERAVILYSNIGETVLTPFMGVGSEVYGALVNGRKGIGIELKISYFKQAQRNLHKANYTQETNQEILPNIEKKLIAFKIPPIPKCPFK